MKIILVQLGRIGDMILLTPAIKALKHKFPNANIDILAGRHNYYALSNNPNINNVIIYEKTPLKLFYTILKLRQNKYDYYIDPKDHKSSESTIFARLAKAATKIGFNLPGTKIFDISLPSEKENAALHFTQRAFIPFKEFDMEIPTNTPTPDLYQETNSIEYVSKYLEDIALNSFYVLNLSASMEHKMWDTENWIKLFREFPDLQKQTVLSYAPPENEKATQLLAQCPDIHNFKSRSLNDAVSLIAQSKLLISPDTAMVHVAAAFNIPLLGLYSGLDDFYAKFFAACSTKEIVRAEKGDFGIKSIQYEDVKLALANILNKINR